MAEDNKKEVKAVTIERKYVDVDTTYKNVLQWAKEGHRLVFISEPDSFLVLSEEHLSELPMEVRRNYRMAKADYDKRKGAFKDDLLSLLSADIEYGAASEQMRVEADVNDPYDYCWVRPENVRKRHANGWSVVTDEVGTQRGLRDTGYHMVGSRELVLVRKRKEQNSADKKRKQDTFTRLFEEQEQSLIEQGNALGMRMTSEKSAEDILVRLS